MGRIGTKNFFVEQGTHMTLGKQNEIWAKTIVAQLIHQGVDYFCLSPGRRSTSLTVAIAENPEAKKFIHFDERGSAFHALGYAKATGKPAAVLVTSGSAVGNLFPAVMEAAYAHVPLILLTSDRPIELRDVMANQTCDQVKIFGDYVRYFFDLPTPREGLPKNFLATTIAQLVHRSQFPLKGPVQLNCPYPEPFLAEETSSPLSIPPTTYALPQLTLSDSCAKSWAEKLQKTKKGVIVIGALPPSSSSSISSLAKKLGWPILPDIISSYRHRADPMTIPHYHHILKALPDLQTDTVLYFGDHLASRALLTWLGNQSSLIQVSSHYQRNDPSHSVSDRVIADPHLFCERLLPLLKQKENDSFLEWKEYSQRSGQIIASFLDEEPTLSEMGVIQTLKQMADERHALFFGSSMPIRDADFFFFPQKPCGPIFANRGLSGIDGNIATCAGIASQISLIATLGDQALLHDLNSLAQLTKTTYPVKVVLINNGGGGIFSFFTPPSKEELWEKYFALSHEKTFEKAASFFDLPYSSVETKEELFDSLQGEKSCLIEVTTIRSENVSSHKNLETEIRSALCSYSSMVS